MSSFLLRSTKAQASAAAAFVAASTMMVVSTSRRHQREDETCQETTEQTSTAPDERRRNHMKEGTPLIRPGLVNSTTIHSNISRDRLFYRMFPTQLSQQSNMLQQSYCQCEAAAVTSSSSSSSNMNRASRLRRIQTLRRMDKVSNKKQTLKETYHIDPEPLGVGAFGAVHLCQRRDTGEYFALKRIPKEMTDDDTFRNEIHALLRVRSAGGHPHICALRESFDEGKEYCLVLELVSGGEMFDHLIKNGAYSEADAARLVREVASSLAFLHGIGIVHSDLKPENLLLSSEQAAEAVIKLVDFGCSVIKGDMDDDDDDDDLDDDSEYALALLGIDHDHTRAPAANPAGTNVGLTPAYSPPEAFDDDRAIEPPVDLWSLGVILFIMLVGFHPYDRTGQATDEDIAKQVKDKSVVPPIRNSKYTRHLSESAIDLLERLMNRDPNKRITAEEMLQHPWVTGETAKTDIIAGSASFELAKFGKFKSRLQRKFFENAVDWSDDTGDETRRQVSLIEQSFRSMGPTDLGEDDDSGDDNTDESGGKTLSMTDFQNLLSENMKNRFFPKGHVIYSQGDQGDHMYFINSGTILVTTKDGSRATRKQGDFFGEGALLHPEKTRSATIKCKTPVHALEISREYFEKYVANSETGLLLTLREKDKIRKKNRAKAILKLSKNLVEKEFKKGEYLFRVGEVGDALYIIKSGNVDVLVGDRSVLTALPGNLCGEHSILTGHKRNSTAVCASPRGCKAECMTGRDLQEIMDVSPDIRTSLRDLCMRRDFKKAVVFRLKKEFPYNNPREAFDAVRGKGGEDGGAGDVLSLSAVGSLLRELNPEYTDEEVLEVVRALDLTNSGTVSFDEFKKVFIADIRTAGSI